MSWVTSRNHILPDDADAFSNGLWFNLWTKKLWPYNELEPGDTLYWYESPSKCIVWKSRVVEVLRFPYDTKKEVEQKLNLTPVQAAQDYFVDGPDAGYCLSYKVAATDRVSISRPDDFKFPHQGWLKVSAEVVAAWPGLSVDRSSAAEVRMAGSLFTRAEVVLCAYAARYNGDDFGGVDAIHSLNARSRDSIQLKVLNIAAMLDEEGVTRESAVNPLSGLPAGQQGRRTNWDVVSELVSLTREQHLAECRHILLEAAALPGELLPDQPLTEGVVRQVLVNRYERDPLARRRCVAHYGPTCVVCGFNFGAAYGPAADGFIHVHHLKPLSEIGSEYVVDPVADLRPVCPNCHAVIHLGGGCRSIEQVQQLLGQHGTPSHPLQQTGGA